MEINYDIPITLSMEEIINNYVNITEKAEKVYKKTNYKFYCSRETVQSFHIATLPPLSDMIFNSYTPSDYRDVKKLRDLANDNYFKVYDCDMCAIQEPDNAILLTDEKNILDSTVGNPALHLNYLFEVNNFKIKFVLSATTPNYYYKHLLLTSYEHLPQYAIFYNPDLFNSLYTFLSKVEQVQPNTIAYFNGNYGSSQYHFHVHLTNQYNNVVNGVIHSVQNDHPYYSSYSNTYKSDNIKVNFYVSNNLDILRTEIFNHIEYFIDLRMNPRYFFSAIFFYRNGRYYLITTVVNTSIRTSTNKYGIVFFPSAFVIGSRIEGTLNLMPFINEMGDKYLFLEETENYPLFLNPKLTYEQFIMSFNNFSIFFNDNTKIEKNELLDIALNNVSKSDLANNYLKDIMAILDSYDCYYHKECVNSQMAIFKTLLSVIFNYSKSNPYLMDDFLNLLIFANWNHMGNMNKFGSINTDYLYFKGDYIKNFLTRSTEKMLRLTSRRKNNNEELTSQTPEILRWLKYNFERIGEASAFGKNTVVKLNYFKFDMVMKIVSLTNQTGNIDRIKQAQFIHEYYLSMAVNKIRNNIPNFVQCFGGFVCNTSNIDTKICDLQEGENNLYGYLFLENIKNSKTFDRSLKRVSTKLPSEQITYIISAVYQIITSLAFAYENNKFTHYDLHLNNIMEYDFINNDGFLTLSKGYKNDKIPLVNGVYFRYVIQDKVLIVPTSFLYIIIDYGTSYINNVNKDKLYVNSDYVRRFGMTSNKPNRNSDIYTLLINLFGILVINREYLFGIDVNGDLYRLMTAFFEVYKNLFTLQSNQIIGALRNLKEAHKYKEFIVSITRDEFKTSSFQYLHPDFNNINSEPFRKYGGYNGPLSWALFLQDTYFSNIVLNNASKFIFNWGNIPESDQGLFPPPIATVQYIDNKHAENIKNDMFTKSFIHSKATSKK